MTQAGNFPMRPGQYERFEGREDGSVYAFLPGGSAVRVVWFTGHDPETDAASARVVAGILRNAQNALDAFAASVEAYEGRLG